MKSWEKTVILLSYLSITIIGFIIFANHLIADNSGTIPLLTNNICINCHPQQPATIDDRGGKHKTKVNCIDCHIEHPPRGTKTIPKCSICHGKAPHYELENCNKCHSDTHAPLDLKLEGDITDPCLTCHPQQGNELKKYPSSHTNLGCSECHKAHRAIPECMECHEKHTEDMDFEACKGCHPVHMPLEVTYIRETPSYYCGTCHKEAADLLHKNTTKHHDLTCVYCHRDKHKRIPPCLACHGHPHPYDMIKYYPECADCHYTAHDLRK
ncbi:MAG: cytochrome C [Proteobacteria bacterium]|nr:cytochrome C [Desulfobacteraceae bacterium]MBU4012684.1 cytochrome C [Pseudomonadota bacterium]MBU4069165.1 cytochrome C [Pseudomonadota bacterium]MBU4101590.1 cytochrome C [Pseudomonadota bacterium]MBU4126002.1 cytochrome C [Pseudomonadota bacterium]